MAQMIDGKAIARRIVDDVAVQARMLDEAAGVRPGLAVVLVADDPASDVYVRRKLTQTRRAGITSFEHRLAKDSQEGVLLSLIDRLNSDPQVHGILVQLPLPAHIDAASVLDRIDPMKDVDGFHPVNVGRLLVGADGLVPSRRWAA